MWKKLSSFGLLIALSFAIAEAPARAQDVSQEDAIRKVLIDLAKAANSADPDKAASLWSDDGLFIDESGHETRGRASLRERFANTLSRRPAGEIALHSEQISFPAPNVALAVGSVSRKSGSVDFPGARFSMVLLKQNDGWSINQVSETAIKETSAADHLKELGWMIGDWRVEGANPAASSAVSMNVEWSGGRSFILSKCVTKHDGQEQIDRQIIGWDPQKKSIVSWHFDNNGGFGCGQWSREADRWIVDFSGVGADGNTNKARNVFALSGPDEFTWQSVDQSTAGIALADTSLLRIKRAK